MRVTTSRERVLAYLRKRGAATAADIARDLGMTRANARHHLALLRSTGSVEALGRRRERGRGRPAALYGLSRALMGDGLPALVAALLTVLLDAVDGTTREARLRQVASLLAEESGARRPPAPGALAARLGTLVSRLNALGYQARWEAHIEGPRVVLGYCPYAAVIGRHPELCRMDAFLLEGILGLDVRQTAKLRGGEQGRPYCLFMVRAR